ncbi:MAG TPA: hypothetical protein VK578_16415 [Edaphobacter sp.]|nr:hypothetical protein [Edaphobacter sp.]
MNAMTATLEQTQINMAKVMTVTASRRSRVEYDPYVQMAVRAKNVAQKLEKDAMVIANILVASAGRERTEREEKRLEFLHNRMTKQEYRLVRFLDPESALEHSVARINSSGKGK